MSQTIRDGLTNVGLKSRDFAIMPSMKTNHTARLAGLILGCGSLVSCATTADDSFVPLFNGKDLTGWTAAKENPDSFFVEDGSLILKGGRSHLFYTGDVNAGSFKEFELKMQVKTLQSSNSGVYIHTKYQDTGWPNAGYECQVNSTHRNPTKTGSLFGVVNLNVLEPGRQPPKVGANTRLAAPPTADGEWFEYCIAVKGRTITTRVNGETLLEYVEPEGGPGHPQFSERKLSEGTFALQAHDPKCEVHFRDIRVKVLDGN